MKESFAILINEFNEFNEWGVTPEQNLFEKKKKFFGTFSVPFISFINFSNFITF